MRWRNWCIIIRKHKWGITVFTKINSNDSEHNTDILLFVNYFNFGTNESNMVYTSQEKLKNNDAYTYQIKLFNKMTTIKCNKNKATNINANLNLKKLKMQLDFYI